MGKRNRKVHMACRRCGRITYHKSKRKCSFCGFGTAGTAKLRNYAWQMKKGLGKSERKI